MNLLKWNWGGQEVMSRYAHVITMLRNDVCYMFAGFNAQGSRLWTLERKDAVVFNNDLEAWDVINKFFDKSEHDRLLIKRFDVND